MFCLLCHEKISRLRAWRTKSEFCCDEHAEVYKRQTLERLLTDQDEEKGGDALPLPVQNTATTQAERESPVQGSAVAETLARLNESSSRASGESLEDRFEQPAQAPELDSGDSDEGLQELWRLADEVAPADGGSDDWSSDPAGLSGDSLEFGPGGFDSLGGGSSGGSGRVDGQTPEEALAALRQLSGGSRDSSSVEVEDSGDAIDALAAAQLREEPSGTPALNAGNEFPDLIDGSLPEEDSLTPLDMGALEPLDDDDLPSVFDRLTEQDSPLGEVELDASAQDTEPAEVEPAAFSSEETSDLTAQEVAAAEEEQPAAFVAAKEDEAGDAAGELAAKETAEELSGESGAFGALEEAVDSHLEDAAEKPANRETSPKVVPFPLSRPKVAASEPESAKPAAQTPAPARSAKSKTRKRAKGAPDLNRVQLKPVATMFGLRPSLCEPESDSGDWTGLTAQGLDIVPEPPMCYPEAGGLRQDGTRPPLVHARLYPVLPEGSEPAALEGAAAAPEWPDYEAPFEPPAALVSGLHGENGRPSIGSERAWMFRIEPTLAEGAEIELQMPNGERHAPWMSLLLPATLLSGVAPRNGSDKLDLSGSDGQFSPSVDRFCAVFPELGELGAGVSPQSSSKVPGELGRWAPPTVLDPRFDVARPAGRELSDFG